MFSILHSRQFSIPVAPSRRMSSHYLLSHSVRVPFFLFFLITVLSIKHHFIHQLHCFSNYRPSDRELSAVISPAITYIEDSESSPVIMSFQHPSPAPNVKSSI